MLSAAWTRCGDSKGFVVPAAGGGWRLAGRVTEAGAAPSTRLPSLVSGGTWRLPSW